VSDESGFEHKGRFYRFHYEEGLGKDMLLVDRISGVGVDEFATMAGDPVQQLRAPILLSLIATSLRNGNPDWSVERIYRTVVNLNIVTDIEFVGTDDEPQDDQVVVLPPPRPEDNARSPSNGSSPSSTPPDSSPSEISFGAPV
jgi:hypothetical protein